MKAYSKDLRLKVLEAVDGGMNRKEVARVFGISLPSIKRWLKRRRQSGDVEPTPITGPPARKGALLEQWLPEHLEKESDLTLKEHCEAFERPSGVKVSTATMSRRISTVSGGWPLKKTPVASERDEELRGLWRWLASHFDARRLVFIDESGFNTSMTRLRSRAPRGERAYGKVPRNRGKNQTLIASLTLEGGVGAALAIKGATDSELFEAYVEEFLAATLAAGQVVVLDGLGAHRTQRVRELIEATGAEMLFLQAISAITLEDVAGWFSHCGYEPRDQYS
jgi:transposase